MQQFNLKQVMQSSGPTRLATQMGKGHLTQHSTMANIEWQSRSSSYHQKNETVFYLQFEKCEDVFQFEKSQPFFGIGIRFFAHNP